MTDKHSETKRTASNIVEKLLEKPNFVSEAKKIVEFGQSDNIPAKDKAAYSHDCLGFSENIIAYKGIGILATLNPKSDVRDDLDNFDKMVNKHHVRDYVVASPLTGKLLAEYLPNVLQDLGIKDTKIWIKPGIANLGRYLVNADLAKALTEVFSEIGEAEEFTDKFIDKFQELVKQGYPTILIWGGIALPTPFYFIWFH